MFENPLQRLFYLSFSVRSDERTTMNRIAPFSRSLLFVAAIDRRWIGPIRRVRNCNFREDGGRPVIRSYRRARHLNPYKRGWTEGRSAKRHKVERTRLPIRITNILSTKRRSVNFDPEQTWRNNWQRWFCHRPLVIWQTLVNLSQSASRLNLSSR